MARSVAAGLGQLGSVAQELPTTPLYTEQLLPRSQALLAAIRAGSSSIMALADEQF
ncbi:hypothetical protein [Azotobacter beijerinckii]|uniref:hypothetical protein n=1 Tax=Azotobacter beijerinckii TaxID=170623 RepID=UPI0014809760|nr:hypothetical protein [Azotobacter beijerinckii]